MQNYKTFLPIRLNHSGFSGETKISMLLNDDIIDIEKPDEICSPTSSVNEFLELFLHPSIFSI